jgi:putative peptidoglycan lipid II flippase
MGEKFGLTVLLGRICFPYLILISITSLFGGVLNAINRFALPALIHSLLSVFVIGGLLVGYWMDLSQSSTVKIASFCVTSSGACQCYLLWNAVKKHGFRTSFKLKCWSGRVKDIMKNMIPGVIGTGVWQLNLLVDTTISSYLPTGSITCIGLADRLNQFPLGTLGVAMSTALLPLLSKLISGGRYEEAGEELNKGLLFASFLTFFATSLLSALSEPSVAVAFQRGMFGEEQVKITAAATMGFSIGLPSYVLSRVFSSVYYADGDTTLPVIFGMFSVVFNVIFLILLVPFSKYFGLATATSLASIVNAFMLMRFTNKNLRMKFTGNFWWKVFSQLVAALITYFFLRELADCYWSADLGTKSVKWLIYLGFICAAAVIFFLSTVACLCLAKQKQWKLWKKESWGYK